MIQKYHGYDGIMNTIVFELDTVNKCNFNCSYCEKQNNSWNPNRDKEEWGKTNNIMELVPFFKGLQEQHRIHLLGGEPTLHPDLDKFIKALPNSDIKLFTNGSNIRVIGKLLENKNLSYTISLHTEEMKIGMLIRLLNKIEIKLSETKHKPNLKFIILLYDIEKNIKLIRNYLNLIRSSGFNYDYYFPFDENGDYNINQNQMDIYQELINEFPIQYLSIGTKSKLNHMDIYNDRETISQTKLCYKNLWLIDHMNTFRFDGTDIKYSLRQVLASGYSMFKHRMIKCNDKCWCPANNYYAKLRL